MVLPRPPGRRIPAENRCGIERAAVLVQGDEQGVRIIPEHILGAVAVVHVRVHDGDAQGRPSGWG